jgi:hypothetical protein
MILLEQPEHQEYIAPEDPGQYTPLDFTSPAEFLEFFDVNISSGFIKLHEWQEWGLNFFANTPKSKEEPLRFNIAASNGSGKDAYLNAVIAVYQLVCKVRSRTIITSASKVQLKQQTNAYISNLIVAVNNKLITLGIAEKPVIKTVNYPMIHHTCSLTGSEIVCFTTDDAGRAEGWHPFPDHPNGEVVLIVNEAKSVPDFIFEAFGRCKYSCLLSISSPGQTSGKFYRDCGKAIQYPEPYKVGQIYMRRITSYDCSHIAKSRIEQDREDWGESSFLFRSCHLAEFTTLNVEVVIPANAYDKCCLQTPLRLDLGLGIHAGTDLAFGGGDAITIYAFDENYFKGYDEFYCDDADKLFEELAERWTKLGLTKKSYINVDDGNMGKLVISKMRNLGWNLTNICNQSPAVNKAKFTNRGAEMYFNVGDIIKAGLIGNLPTKESNAKLYRQLTNRYYDESGSQGRKGLESKAKHRGRTGESPDHSDAFVLAWAGYSLEDLASKKNSGAVSTQSVNVNLIAQIPQGTFKFDDLFKRNHKKDDSKAFNPYRILRGIYGQRNTRS